MACPGCEVIPTLRTQASYLYLAPKLAHTRAMAVRRLRERGWQVAELEGQVLSVTVTDGDIEALLQDLSSILSRPEQSNCPALLLPMQSELSVRHLGAMEPLSVLVARQEHAWLSDLLRNERLQMHFQPILHADSGSRVFAFESLARGIGQDGQVISPGQLFPAARATELMFHLDRAGSGEP